MTDLVDRTAHPVARPSATSRAHLEYGRRATLASAMAQAAWAAALGLIAITVVVMAAWASSGSATSAAGALRVAASAWLLSQHVGLALGPLPSEHLGIVPLGLFLLPALLLYRAGLSIARTVDIHGWRDGWLGIGGMAAAYAAIAGIVAGMTTSAEVRPAPLQSLLVPWALAMICGTLGALRHGGLGRRLLLALPPAVRSCLRVGTMTVVVQLVAGAALVAAMLLDHLDLATSLGSSLHAGTIGGATLLLLTVAFLLTAVVWAMAYVVGTGFSVGVHTGVTPFAHHLGAVPDLPILAAVPSGPSPGWAPMLIAIPVLAGVLAGWRLGARTRRLAWWRVPLAGLGAGVVAGLLVAGLAGLSGGPAGNARLVTVGPSAWRAGLAAALEIGLAAAVVALARHAATPYAERARLVASQTRAIILGARTADADLYPDDDLYPDELPDMEREPTRGPAPVPPPPPSPAVRD